LFNYYFSQAKTLVAAANDTRYPEMGKIVCNGLTNLIGSNLAALSDEREEETENEEAFKSALYEEEEGDGEEDQTTTLKERDSDAEEDEGEDEDEELYKERSKFVIHKKHFRISKEVARSNIDAIIPFAAKFLPVLFNLLDASHGEWPAPPSPPPHLGYGAGGDAAKANDIMNAIAALAEITPSDALSSLFHTVLKKLLKATNDMAVDGGGDGQARRTAVILMGLVSSIAKPLNKDDIVLLYRLVKPTITDSVISLLQQRSYAVLFQMCSCHSDWVKENLYDVATLLRSSLLTVTSSAKKSRLRSLGKVVQLLDEKVPEQLSLMPELLGEVMLCLKESNKRARSAAFDLIVIMSRKMQTCGDKNPKGAANLGEFIKMVIAGLAATTPHMRSATVLALARLVFEYKTHPTVLEMAPTILKLTLMLLNEKSREVIKSVLGFTKVMISALDSDTLSTFLADICSGVLVWSGESKHR
jgi:ribosomal RNA-processing protein 12